MDRKKIVSSNLSSVGYDPNNMTLEVEFYDGKVYSYKPVTMEAYILMMNSTSVGSYFSKNIRNNKNIVVEKVKG